MNLQNTKNYLSKIIGVIALIMTLSVVFPSMAHVLTGQSTSPNIAHAEPGEGYTGKAETEEEAKKQAKEDSKKDDSDDKKDDDDDKKKDDEESDDEKSEDGDGEGEGENKSKGKNKAINDYTVMYAQIIMGSAIEEQKKEEDSKNKGNKVEKFVNNTVSSIIGDGGVALDVNYSEMSYYNKQLLGRDTSKYEGGENGQQLASTFKTFNYYGYINTVSGNSIVSGGKGAIAGIGRTFGGVIAFVGLVLFWAIRTISYWLLTTLAQMNPYHFVGFKQGAGLMPDNPLSTATSKFFEGFGMNGEVITTITELGLIIILFLLGIGVIRHLTKARFREAGQSGKKWLVRIFVIFAMFPVLALTATGISKSVSKIAEQTNFQSSPTMRHLLNQRVWASGTNLSPSGLNGMERPTSKAEEDYLDKSYVPSSKKGRNLIKQINTVGYENMYGMTDETKISFSLIGRWMKDENFNVNTYMGDLRSGKADNGELPGMANFKEVYAKHKKVKPSELSRANIKSAIWSSTQNVNEKTKDVTNENYNPALKIGTSGGQSLSTQSVALMLQSSFDDTSAKFYAYNFAPSGLQGNMKNLMTVKTEWKELTLPGEGVLGVFGSWLSLIAESIAYICVASAVILALLTTNMFAAMIAFVKHIFRALVSGSINSAMATFLIYLGGIGSVLISVALPGLFIKLIQSIGDGIRMATQEVVPSGIVEIITAIALIFFSIYLSFRAKLPQSGKTPVKLLATILTDMAMDFEKRVSELDKKGGNTNIGNMARGVSNTYGNGVKNASNQMSAKMSEDANRTKNMAKVGAHGMKSGVKNTTLGAIKGAKSGAIKGVVGGPAGMIAGAGRGALAGGGKSALMSAKNTASDMNQARKGQDSENVIQSRKDSDKANNQGYSGKDALNDYNDSHAKHLAGSEVKGAKESAMKYGHMPYGITPNQRLSEQSTANKDELNKVTNESDLYKDNDQADMRKFSATAGQSAKEAVDEYNQPMFSQEEYQRLRRSENEDEFVDNLQDTNRGMEYAMNSTSAKTQLKDSRFTDDAGNISMDEINKFNKETDQKFRTGNMSQQDWADKSKLDNAFVLGAQEKYRRPNSKFNRGGTFTPEDIESAKKTSVKSATGVASQKKRPRSTMNERKQSRATSTPSKGAKTSMNRQTTTKRQTATKQQQNQEKQFKEQTAKHKKQAQDEMKRREKQHREQSRRNKRQFKATEEQAQKEHDRMIREQQKEQRRLAERRRQQAELNKKKRANVKRLTTNDVINNRKKR